ncbi:TetR/AcrR family transcriptional regulator [Vibrio sp. SCSIO 43136]|uniref:TetR/AcrR family transcriptional regulator n=1 Tax=Vibrio sp. SCSIO 43136 TaxID=2819101 RepID=UPI002075E117|nr:TetR/AcrR family transcriptional regulator [Vibrio sp. SCSIO 43136]USD68044.1 TetR/AcrR family transcriptional regulator [Vibrio sp. SCSIO 43136]
MPKIVDHHAYRQELATKAIQIFTQHGFNGLGMRGIAEALGISKSALYHYFPSKEELFKASTEAYLAPSSIYGLEDGEEIPQNTEQALTLLISTLDSHFRGELTLLLDYTKSKSHQQIEQDNLLALAHKRFREELSRLTDQENVDQAYALLLGGLTMRLMDGGQTEITTIVGWIVTLTTKHN